MFIVILCYLLLLTIFIVVTLSYNNISIRPVFFYLFTLLSLCHLITNIHEYYFNQVQFIIEINWAVPLDYYITIYLDLQQEWVVWMRKTGLEIIISMHSLSCELLERNCDFCLSFRFKLVRFLIWIIVESLVRFLLWEFIIIVFFFMDVAHVIAWIITDLTIFFIVFLYFILL